MKPERWKQVDKLLQAALALDPEDRPSFLDHACKSDAALRREIDSLLEAHDSAGSFIESPAIEASPSLIVTNAADPILEQPIGPYRILAHLGSGGMGEVYLAQDGRLGRKVALKLLPDYFTTDEQRVQRFKQEAQAASALNHPNIITIYDIGESEDRHFIATEFVEGETLRQRMASHRLSLGEALDVAAQIAGALTVAHQAGIVHRDVKPENIMLRPDGYVKVLDFGLAKLTEPRHLATGTQAPTVVRFDTEPGTVVGTANYMSPEQARGQAVDARTDIFSLGVVTYEMLAGRPPFEGETPSDVIAAILKTEPAPLTQHLPDAAAELQCIVTKSLRKQKDERYRTAKELLSDLTEIKERLHIQSKLERSQPPEPSNAVAAQTIGAQAVVGTAGPQVAPTAEAAARTTSSAKIIISEIKRHKRAAITILAIVAIVVAGAAYGLYKLFSKKQTEAPLQASNVTQQTLKISRLTNNGKTRAAAISPDGKYLAYILWNGKEGSIWLRLVDDPNSTIQIVPIAPNANTPQLAYSPDGKSVYYVLQEGLARSAIYQVPVLGGTPKKVIDNGWALSIFPDGRRIAFLRRFNQDEVALMIANIDGTGEQVLTTRKTPGSISPRAWSPDGKKIACFSGTVEGNNLSYKLVEVEVADGSEKEISPMSFSNALSAVWLSDGSGLLVTGSEQGTDISQLQIWHISYPGGEARKIINDLNSYRDLSLTADSSQLVATQSEAAFNVFVLPQGDASRAVSVTSGRHSYTGLSWTPDGKIIYQNADTGDRGVSIMEADGTKQRKLRSEPCSHASISPDGRYIVFMDRGIWRMDVDGSNQKQLTGSFGFHPQCSPDGKWVIFVSRAEQFLMKMPIDGGEPVRMTDKQVFAPAISPDGNLIACNYREQPGAPWKIALLSFEDGSPVKVFDIPGNLYRRIRWSADGRTLTYTQDSAGVTNIWTQAIDGGPPRRLTNFTDGEIRTFAWSHDGKQLAIVRGSFVADVVLISNFR